MKTILEIYYMKIKGVDNDRG